MRWRALIGDVAPQSSVAHSFAIEDSAVRGHACRALGEAFVDWKGRVKAVSIFHISSFAFEAKTRRGTGWNDACRGTR